MVDSLTNKFPNYCLIILGADYPPKYKPTGCSFTPTSRKIIYYMQSKRPWIPQYPRLFFCCIQAAYNKPDDRIRIRDTTILKYLSFYAGGYSRIPFMYRVGTVYIIQIKHIEK